MKRLKSWYSIGQSATEYAVLLALVAAALIAMQVYLKRGIQGRVKDLADQISAEQYEAGRTVSEYNTEQFGKTVQIYEDGIATTEIPESWIDEHGQEHKGEELERWGNETVSPEEQR